MHCAKRKKWEIYVYCIPFIWHSEKGEAIGTESKAVVARYRVWGKGLNVKEHHKKTLGDDGTVPYSDCGQSSQNSTLNQNTNYYMLIKNKFHQLSQVPFKPLPGSPPPTGENQVFNQMFRPQTSTQDSSLASTLYPSTLPGPLHHSS